MASLRQKVKMTALHRSRSRVTLGYFPPSIPPSLVIYEVASVSQIQLVSSSLKFRELLGVFQPLAECMPLRLSLLAETQ
jgi:hypothetical protein